MLNRAVEIKLVKKKESNNPTEIHQDVDPVDYEELINKSIEKVSEKIAIGFVGYVALTTLSKVIIKMTPTR